MILCLSLTTNSPTTNFLTNKLSQIAYNYPIFFGEEGRLEIRGKPDIIGHSREKGSNRT